MKMPVISQEQVMQVLDKCYDASINGIPGSKSCELLASEYLEKYPDTKTAVHKMINQQVLKCSTSGFVTSLGGLITMPITLPANITSVIYIQLRMIATIAVMGGYNIHDDEVQTLAYVCLVGTSISEICKKAGVEVTNKITLNLLKKLPGSVLIKINQRVGTRLLTKFGTKGIINLGKLVPVAGGIIGGGLDYTSTKLVAQSAYKKFILNQLD